MDALEARVDRPWTIFSGISSSTKKGI